MSRLLWLSDGGCTTGFGQVTHQIGERLARDYGHEIHVIAVNHRGDYFPSLLDPSKPTPLRLYTPTKFDQSDMYGTSRFLELLGELGESKGGLDGVVVLNDPFVFLQFLFDNRYDPQRVLLQYRPILYYAPVDGVNLPPRWTGLIPEVSTVVAMSKWGQGQFTPSSLAYHGVDRDHYWPVKEKPITLSNGSVCRTKRDCKKAFGMDPDRFVIGRVDSNSGRKDYPALVKALVPVMRRHSDIDVWLHTQTVQMQHGVDIGALWSRYPDIDQKRVFTPGRYTQSAGWPTQDMNALMNAFDIFVSTSRGEGFGLSLAQSLACGVPVVAQNVSAIPEVVGPGGVLIEPLDRLITVPAGHDMWLADIDAFSQAIEHLHESRGAVRKLGEAGREHVVKTFDWDDTTALFHRHITGLSQTASPELEVGAHA